MRAITVVKRSWKRLFPLFSSSPPRQGLSSRSRVVSDSLKYHQGVNPQQALFPACLYGTANGRLCSLLTSSPLQSVTQTHTAPCMAGRQSQHQETISKIMSCRQHTHHTTHRITESQRLGKTSRMPKPNPSPPTTSPAAHPCGSGAPPGQ